MRLPKVHGVIRRRLLVNFRIEPTVVQRNLPAPFRPKLHEGHAIAGICLIRLEEIRPKRFPRMFGLSSENAAQRVAVVWEDDTGSHEGVYIQSADGQVRLEVIGRAAVELPPTSVFRTLREASAFFEPGAVGYSATASGRRLDHVVLTTHSWSVAPLAIERVFSSYFADERLFPTGTVSFDCALIMRNIAHEWQAGAALYV